MSYHESKTRLLTSAATRHTLRHAVETFHRMDPVDALNDAITLHLLMRQRFDLTGKLIEQESDTPIRLSGLYYVTEGGGQAYANWDGTLVSTPIMFGGEFSRWPGDWTVVTEDDPHDEIMAAKAALGIRTTLGEVLGPPLSSPPGNIVRG